MNLRIYSSKTRTKETLEHTSNTPLSLYVCGITPYDYAHIGHGRCYVSFDLLIRILRSLSIPVTYTRNITDVDDKIIARAEDKTPAGLVAYTTPYIKAFHDDLVKLTTLPPTNEPTVSDNMGEIISFIEELIARKHAYESEGDVYFDRGSYAAYGALSGRSTEELLVGARILPGEKKRNPGDFALWKGNTTGEFWHSPWGWGRPGWHIECSALIKKYCGTTVDIHAGGIDLLFPHHENEAAQSEALTGKTLAHYWMHNAHVMIDKEKMSKSLGNSTLLRDIFIKTSPQLLKFFFLQHHYRTPLDFTLDRVKEAERAYRKIAELTLSVPENLPIITFTELAAHRDLLIDEICEALLDDCNAPRAIGLVFKHYTEIVSDKEKHDLIGRMIRDILGLTLDTSKDDSQLAQSEISEEIQALLEQRAAARAEKDWALADQIRDELIARGYVIQDKK